MEKDDFVVSLCIILIASAALRIRRDRKMPCAWAQPWIRVRAHHGAHHSLMRKLAAEDELVPFYCFSSFMFLKNTLTSVTSVIIGYNAKTLSY